MVGNVSPSPDELGVQKNMQYTQKIHFICTMLVDTGYLWTPKHPLEQLNTVGRWLVTYVVQIIWVTDCRYDDCSMLRSFFSVSVRQNGLLWCQEDSFWTRVTSSEAVAADIAINDNRFNYFLTADEATLHRKIMCLSIATETTGVNEKLQTNRNFTSKGERPSSAWLVATCSSTRNSYSLTTAI